jgi:phosphoribosylanthranilate isomerase
MSGLVKICGLSEPETLVAALEAGADMIGLVFFERSPRHVDLERAADLAARVRAFGPPRPEVVALTVNADDATVSAIMERVRPDWLQLHGSESPERCAELKARFNVKVMKALGISEPGDIDRAAPYVGVADRLLFDARPPKGSDIPGGNGVSFDWRLLAGLDLKVPLMLSGGLDAASVGLALKTSGLCDVDVSSGVERERGVKDAGRIREFVAAARHAGRQDMEHKAAGTAQKGRTG